MHIWIKRYELTPSLKSKLFVLTNWNTSNMESVRLKKKHLPLVNQSAPQTSIEVHWTWLVSILLYCSSSWKNDSVTTQGGLFSPKHSKILQSRFIWIRKKSLLKEKSLLTISHINFFFKSYIVNFYTALLSHWKIFVFTHPHRFSENLGWRRWCLER